MEPVTPSFASFGTGLDAAVVGASGGIGRALVAHLRSVPAVRRVFALSRSARPVEREDLVEMRLDVTDEGSIAAAAETVARHAGELHLVIVATGILHDGGAFRPEKSWREIDAAALGRAFAVNAAGPALVAKHFLPLLARRRKAAFAALSARVGSIGDNRLGGWYAYRASKAALNQTIRTLSIELARRNPTALCVGLHPGTVDTDLSKPFQRGVPEGKLFPPAEAAAHLLGVLDGLTPAESGRLFAWDGSEVPP